MVQVSTSPGFDRIWDRDGSGPRFDSVQDSTFVTNVVSVSITSSIDIILLSHTSLIKNILTYVIIFTHSNVLCYLERCFRQSRL